MAINQEELLRVGRQANSLFVVPGGIDRLLAPMASCDNIRPMFSQIASAFSSNIKSVIFTAGIPYMFALEASHRRRYQLFVCAAELEAVLEDRAVDAADNVDVTEVARTDAQKRIHDLSDSEEGRAALNHETCCFLLDVSKSEELREAAEQLVRQASVLTWGAFEVLSRDVFKEYLNRTPGAYARLVADVDVRRRFELGKVSLERVADFGFDLSAKLGELLADQNDLSDCGTIKASLLALFPTNSRLRTALGQRDLWKLFQQRNLIVHRRGIVDCRYLEATGDERENGTSLVLKPRELTGHIEIVVEAASALLSAADAG